MRPRASTLRLAFRLIILVKFLVEQATERKSDSFTLPQKLGRLFDYHSQGNLPQSSRIGHSSQEFCKKQVLEIKIRARSSSKSMRNFLLSLQFLIKLYQKFQEKSNTSGFSRFFRKIPYLKINSETRLGSPEASRPKEKPPCFYRATS